jgi:glycosyltransferase involved in cell wall biosynthesis
MKDENLNIALFSPNKNAYSETFIQIHKDYLKGNVFYYYGGGYNKNIEGHKRLASRRTIFFYKLIKILCRKRNNFVQCKSIIHSLKKNKIKVVLVEYGTHANQMLPLVMEANIPMIAYFHGYDASIYEVIKRNNRYKELFAYATKVIVVSKKMEQMLQAMGCPDSKIVYNPCAPNLEFESLKPKFSKKQFISVGRFTDKKAPYYTILAFAKVLKEHPDAQLIMGGQGLLLNVCENLVNHLQIQNNVQLLGVITPKEFRGYLSESIAYVQHSIRASNGDMEGTPVSIMEASSAGIPVISTFHAGIPDVILDGETGLLVNEHDVDGMTEKMIQLLDDRDLCIQLGAKGKERVKANFNLQKHLNKIDTLIEQIVSVNG